MNDVELFAFMDVFRKLLKVFPKRGDAHDVTDLGSSYFKALRRRTLKEVSAGADAWLEHGRFFPKPAEWLRSIPRQMERPAVQAMAEDEAREYRRAEGLRYEDQPCRCRECVAAGISDKPLRFVPEFTADDADRKVFDPIGKREVTAGHWAHGAELARWYVARADFWNAYYTAIGPVKGRKREQLEPLVNA
jgi:hypothetical protein